MFSESKGLKPIILQSRCISRLIGLLVHGALEV